MNSSVEVVVGFEVDAKVGLKRGDSVAFTVCFVVGAEVLSEVVGAVFGPLVDIVLGLKDSLIAGAMVTSVDGT